MSVTEVQGRISDIQAQLSLLGPQATTPLTASTPATATMPGSAAAFAASLAKSRRASAVATPSGVGTASTGRQVVDEARKYLGVPYVWGGTDPKRGLDCSGLVQLVYKKFGVDLPRVSYEQAKAGEPVAGGLANARPGDLLAFGSPVHHIAIYAGNGKMIEAPRPGLSVREVDVYETPTAVRRVLPTVASTTSGEMSLAGVGGLGAPSSQVSGNPPYASLFSLASEKYGVDADLLVAVARQESGFNPRAVSPAGAQGLMQLMPGTARGLGVKNSFDPAQAIDGAARLLKSLQQEFGRTDLALAAYNAGPGAVHRYDGIPPYPETKNYVNSIMTMLGGS
jgi:cell wall-associated NlpC family hydrolase